MQFSALQVSRVKRFAYQCGIHVASLSPPPSLTTLAQAMSALLCCGHIFYTPHLQDDGIIYKWLDLLLTSKDEKVSQAKKMLCKFNLFTFISVQIYQLARDTVVLLLESNPDMGQLLEWVIDRCYTSTPREADACFLALASIFSAK